MQAERFIKSFPVNCGAWGSCAFHFAVFFGCILLEVMFV